MRPSPATLLAALTLPLSALAASTPDDKTKAPAPMKPCTAQSRTSGNFFDISSLTVHAPAADSKKKDPPPHSWTARGYDYGANFTMNICGPVIEDLKALGGVEDLKSSAWRNVSAYYTRAGSVYSIGSTSQAPVVRGRKLVLNYTDGSLCAPSARADPDDRRRKSSIISLLCERDPKDGDPAVSVAFVGASPDECTYFFEARSPAACPRAKVQQQALSPGGVFGVIATIALLAYLIGGIMYQRIVQHQRGWRQLPNYTLWSGAFGFVRDFVIILLSSCARCIPGLSRLAGGRKGYSRVGAVGGGGGGVGGPNGFGRARASSDDENRLIDQLDEEWED